jgi:hypothetical protein
MNKFKFILPILLLFILSFGLAHASAFNVYIQNTIANPAVTFPLGAPATCANTLGGSCVGTDVITGSKVLTSSLFITGNLLLPGGTVLTTNGYSIIASQTANWIGATIYAGAPGNGGPAATSSNGVFGGSVPLSYGGSGAGGGGLGSTYGGSGGNTLIAGGAGGTSGSGGNGANGANVPIYFTASNIVTWYGLGFKNIFTGAGGGSGQDSANHANAGGSGSYGIYVQAMTVNAGTIEANGILGICTDTTQGSGGSGGGGIIGIAYGSTYHAGTYNVLGGPTVTGCSSGNGGAGGIGNVVTLNYVTPPIPIYQSVSNTIYYPYYLYTNDINPSNTYSLYQGSTLLQSNVVNIGFVAPANQVTGIYGYNVLQFNGVLTAPVVSVNASISMLDIQNALTFNVPIIQYFPNIANFSLGSFTAGPPTSWKLWSYPNTQSINYGINTIQGSVFGSNQVTFPVNVQLNYPAPFGSFNISLYNNPAVQTTITQTAFSLYPSNAGGTGITTRPIINISTFNQRTFNTLYTNTTFGGSAIFNNYSFNIHTSNYDSNTFDIFMPQSNYINPNIYLYNETTLSQTPNFFQAINNYCPTTLTSAPPTNTVSYAPYLVDANGSIYQFQVFTASGQPATNYYMITQENNGNKNTQVGSLKIGTSPFGYPLEAINIQYRFLFYNPSCGQLVYTTPLSVPISPIQITLPQNSSYNQVPIGNAIATCTSNPVAGNDIQITCSGVDSQNFITSWTTSIFTITTVYQIQRLNSSYNASGSSFSYTTNSITNTAQYRAVVVGCTGTAPNKICEVVYDNLLNNTPHYINPFAAGGALIAILVLFTFIMLGSEISLELMIPFTLLGLFLAEILDIIPLPTYMFYAIIAVSVITMVMLQ